MATKSPQIQRANKANNLILWSHALSYFQTLKDGIHQQDRDMVIGAIAMLQITLEKGVELNGSRSTRISDGTRR